MTSPFSFHCIVCIEEFDAEQRYPVVLPCGHTYVCNECANRLDKCMECRTALSIMLPNATRPVPPTPTRRGPSQVRPGWTSSASVTPDHESPPFSRRLPLPKNVVLMSLMEATALMSQDSPESSPIRHCQSLGDTEEECIRVGTSLAIGMCGTYVITKATASVFPSQPSKSAYQRPLSDVPEEEDFDTLVRYFHMDSQNSKSDTHLKRGDRVQIVSLEDGWAKLARGYGFIKAEAGQLVKVGPPVDRACRLEAALRSLAVRRRTLKSEKSQLDNQVITLMRDLHTSLMQDDDTTVVSAELPSKDLDTANVNLSLEGRDNESSARSNVPDGNSSKPNTKSKQNSVSGVGSIDQHGNVMDSLSFESLTFGSYNSMAAAHQSNYRALSAVAVDFRTGLSGHMALTSTHIRAIDSPGIRTPVPKMSSHSGLSVSRPSRATPPLNLPQLSSAASVASAPSRLITPPRSTTNREKQSP